MKFRNGSYVIQPALTNVIQTKPLHHNLNCYSPELERENPNLFCLSSSQRRIFSYIGEGLMTTRAHSLGSPPAPEPSKSFSSCGKQLIVLLLQEHVSKATFSLYLIFARRRRLNQMKNLDVTSKSYRVTCSLPSHLQLYCILSSTIMSKRAGRKRYLKHQLFLIKKRATELQQRIKKKKKSCINLIFVCSTIVNIKIKCSIKF